MNHKFIELITDQEGRKIHYFKCQLCGKVMFETDPYFNMICQYKVDSKEKLREELEGK